MKICTNQLSNFFHILNFLMLTMFITGVSSVISMESSSEFIVGDVSVDVSAGGSGLVWFKNVSDPGAFSMQLRWDNSVVHGSVDVGVSDYDAVVWSWMNSSGMAVLSLSSIYDLDGVSGDVVVVGLDFVAVGGSGSLCDVVVDSVSLYEAGSGGSEVSLGVRNGVVSVVDDSSGGGDTGDDGNEGGGNTGSSDESSAGSNQTSKNSANLSLIFAAIFLIFALFALIILYKFS